jgi:hypothetical protein
MAASPPWKATSAPRSVKWSSARSVRAVRAGAFEPFVASDVEEAAIAEIFDFDQP